MVVTDLDGTLARSDSTFSGHDLSTLSVVLPAVSVLRVIATGRSLISAKKVLSGPEFPLDFLVFSSGAGIFDWRTQQLVWKTNLNSDEIRSASCVMKSLGIDYFEQFPVPDNHLFYSHQCSSIANPDFLRRIQINSNFQVHPEPPNRDSESEKEKERSATQLLGIVPSSQRQFFDEIFKDVSEKLSGLQVIRATSPIDGSSMWIEIFPKGVTKASASEWIAKREDVDEDCILSVGNDFNDLSLLEWSPFSCLVNNLSHDFKDFLDKQIRLRPFRLAQSNDQNGFSAAITLWLKDEIPRRS